jgi:hypothetical protein
MCSPKLVGFDRTSGGAYDGSWTLLLPNQFAVFRECSNWVFLQKHAKKGIHNNFHCHSGDAVVRTAGFAGREWPVAATGSVAVINGLLGCVSRVPSIVYSGRPTKSGRRLRLWLYPTITMRLLFRTRCYSYRTFSSPPRRKYLRVLRG